MNDSEIGLREYLLWYVLVIGKMRLGWLLYNLVYIHIYRRNRPNETFEHLSFSQWYYLAMKDLFATAGLDYDEIKKERKES